MIFQKHNYSHRLKAILCFFKFKVWTKLHFRESDNFVYVYLNVTQEELLDRYLLNFLQQLNSRKATIIVIPLRSEFLRRFFEGRNWRPYQTALIESGQLHFALKTAKWPWKSVSWNYFGSIPDNAENLRIPIGPHPIHFENFRETSVNQFRTGIFFAGAQAAEYDSCFSKEIWEMPNRMESIKFLQKNGQGQIISGRINPDQYHERMKSSRFFLALPGMHMPLCHNVFEAIFSGCIPIIHVLYLQLLPKELKDTLMPYSWESHDELLKLLAHIEHEAIDIAHEERAQKAMQVVTNSYYQNPNLFEAVDKAKNILICGEEHSVQLHKSELT